jgi:hypothetical protein
MVFRCADPYSRHPQTLLGAREVAPQVSGFADARDTLLQSALVWVKALSHPLSNRPPSRGREIEYALDIF